MPDKEQASSTPPPSEVRIIIVIGPLHLGGAERQAILLADYLARHQNARVEVWGYGEPGRAAELCDLHGITWRSMPIPLPWSSSRFTQLKRLARFAMSLRRAKPDVILPFMFLPTVACCIVWRLTGARVCFWNQRDEGRDRLGRITEKLAVRLAPYFIANSEHGANFLTQELGVNRDLLHVVHNGVQLAPRQWDRAEWRNQLGVDEDCFLACMVANLQRYKDHVTLLKAWRIVRDRLEPMNRPAVLLLAGRFDEMHLQLKALAHDLDLGRSVRFLGAVKDVSGLLGSVDLGIHSSVNEGCPNGVLECMAAGLAVVGTDYPGIREAVGLSGYRFLAAPADAAELAEEIIAMAGNPEGRREAGMANRLRIETEFDSSDMCRKMWSLIADGLGRPASSLPISSDREVIPGNHQAGDGPIVPE
jgi:glycosyltransferase involved in cell wall biosynthesis